MINELFALKKALKLSDLDIIGDWLMPEDVGRDHIAAAENYAWYYVIGQYFKPQRIAEIGVKYGYSMKALWEGSKCEYIEGYDNMVHRPGSNTIARDRLTKAGIKHKIYDAASYNIPALISTDFDLIHVDGDHSYRGALQDMGLVWPALKVGGVLLVDDIYYHEEVQKAMLRYCRDNNLITTILPSYRGLAVIIKGESNEQGRAH